MLGRKLPQVEPRWKVLETTTPTELQKPQCACGASLIPNYKSNQAWMRNGPELNGIDLGGVKISCKRAALAVVLCLIVHKASPLDLQCINLMVNVYDLCFSRG